MSSMTKAGALASVLALCLGGGAMAQVAPFGWNPGTQVDSGDWRLLSQSAAVLNRLPSPRPGETRSWSNPQTGHAGTVSVDRVFRQDGMPCHALRYAIIVAAGQTTQNYAFNWCRTETGEWKILP